MSALQLNNFFGGTWVESPRPDDLPVMNPATAEILGLVPLTRQRPNCVPPGWM